MAASGTRFREKTPESQREELPHGSLGEETAVRRKEEVPGSDSGGRLQVNSRTAMLWLGRKSPKWDPRRKLLSHRGFMPRVWAPSQH